MKNCLYICSAEQDKQYLSIHTTNAPQRALSASQTLFGSCSAKQRGNALFCVHITKFYKKC